MKRTVHILLHLCALTLAANAVAARAQGLSDPTLMPPGLGQLKGGDAGSGNPLQSIILSGGRKVAVISGQSVPLGGMYGDARLVSITPTQVTLKQGDSLQVLKLHEGVEKKSPAAVTKKSESKAVSGGPTRGNK